MPVEESLKSEVELSDEIAVSDVESNVGPFTDPGVEAGPDPGKASEDLFMEGTVIG